MAALPFISGSVVDGEGPPPVLGGTAIQVPFCRPYSVPSSKGVGNARHRAAHQMRGHHDIGVGRGVEGQDIGSRRGRDCRDRPEFLPRIIQRHRAVLFGGGEPDAADDI